MLVYKIAPAGPKAFAITYADYGPGDPACCPTLPSVTIIFRWNGAHMIPLEPIPPGVYGLNDPHTHPVYVRLQ